MRKHVRVGSDTVQRIELGLRILIHIQKQEEVPQLGKCGALWQHRRTNVWTTTWKWLTWLVLPPSQQSPCTLPPSFLQSLEAQASLVTSSVWSRSSCSAQLPVWPNSPPFRALRNLSTCLLEPWSSRCVVNTLPPNLNLPHQCCFWLLDLTVHDLLISWGHWLLYSLFKWSKYLSYPI